MKIGLVAIGGILGFMGVIVSISRVDKSCIGSNISLSESADFLLRLFHHLADDSIKNINNHKMHVVGNAYLRKQVPRHAVVVGLA